jgi:phosphoserine phosphatase
MPLSKTQREGREHLYFTLGGSKKLYLGTSQRPRTQNLGQALEYLEAKIKKYEEEKSAVQRLLPTRKFRKKYRLIVFDLDGVVYDKPWRDVTGDKVAVSSWDVLFKELGIYPMHERLRARFESGGFKSYMEWSHAACGALQMAGLDRDTFDRVMNARSLTSGAEEVLTTLHQSEAFIAVVTGSFQALAERLKVIVPTLKCGAHCSLVFDQQGTLKKWDLKDTDYEDKKKFVLKLANDLKIPKEERAYIGDDVNDLGAFEEVGLSVAFNAHKAEVRRRASVVIDSRNLKAILPHLQADEDSVGSDFVSPRGIASASAHDGPARVRGVEASLT